MLLNLKTSFSNLFTIQTNKQCADISPTACQSQQKSYRTHVWSLSLTKLGDGLLDPKLVLSSLLILLGSPMYLVAMLVPVRESLALFPQIFTASYIQQLKIRKVVWSFGAFVQGVCAFVIAASALFLEGKLFGWVALVTLSVFAVARSLCSVTYKDVLGKTIDKSNRGVTTGLAGSVAAAGIIIFALIVINYDAKSIPLLVSVIFVASGLWIMASLSFIKLHEEDSEIERRSNPFEMLRKSCLAVKSDKQLVLFIITRALLLGTALAPPFIVASIYDNRLAEINHLGYMLLASSIAGLISSYTWGRLSDKNSKLVLVIASLLSSVVFIILLLAEFYDQSLPIHAIIFLLFVLLVAYQGVRVGRSTHLVDMANTTNRAQYTAISNTIIGVLLMGTGLISIIFEQLGSVYLFLMFTMMSIGATLVATRLKKVQ